MEVHGGWSIAFPISCRQNPTLPTTLATDSSSSPACKLYGYWDAAHNFFLEGWLGFGGVFLVCATLTYYKLLQTLMHGIRERQRLRFVPLASLCLLVIVTLHSLVDFSLQIPGVGVMVAATLGAGCAISLTRGS